MGSYLNPGSAAFCNSLRSKIYIDKSALIARINELICTEQRFVCVSRPRRFGKSMAANMLAAYYERGEDSSSMFDSLKISNADSYQIHKNKYDVLKVNIQEFLSMTHNMDDMLSMLQKYIIFDLQEHFEGVHFRDENNLIQVMKDIYNKRNLVNFFDGTTGLMQVLIFFLLGLLSFPSRIPAVIGPALLTGLFIMVVARPIAVFLVMLPFKSKLKQILLVAFAGLRGASSIVFAIFAVLSVNTDNDIFHFVFFIVLFSILFQGSLLPFVAKKLGMIDTKADVMKTFNDYAEEVPVQFIQVDIPKEHTWCNRKIKDIILPPQTLIVLLKRNGENIIPNGDTLLLPEDTLILSAISPEQVDGITLSEIVIDEGSRYLGKKLSEIPKKEGSLVVMIMRNDSIVIPNGSISLEEGDTIVVI